MRSLHRGGFDAMYYWDQFYPILAAILILLVGWIIALNHYVAAIAKGWQQSQASISVTGRTPNIETEL